MRVRIRISGARGESEVSPEKVFSYGYRQRRRATPFVVSVCAHVVLIALSSTRLGNVLANSNGMRLPHGVYVVRPLNVLIPERIYYTRMDAAKARARVNSRPAQGKGRKPGTPHSARSAAPRLPNGIELPRFAAGAQQRYTVLQPQVQPLAAALPAQAGKMIAWSTQPEKRKLIKPDLPVVPGRVSAITGADRQNAPPTPDIPNQEPEAGTINIANQNAGSQPRLPVRASSTTPVRVETPGPITKPRSAALSGPLEGDPANILMLLPSRAAAGQVLSIPPGISIADDRGAPSSADNKQTQGGSPGSGGIGGPSVSTAMARGAATDPAPHTGAASGAAEGSAAASSPLAAAGMPHASAPNPNAAPNPVTLHPIYGTYDVTVVQSSLDDAFGDNRNLLSGKPVYTVYLQVGTRQQWTLHFCSPPTGESRPAREQAVIVLGELERIEAPLPLRTVIPEALMLPRSKYVLIHGFLDRNGQFVKLQMVPGSDGVPSPQDCLAAFSQWVFRPAIRGKAPVEIETLLAVPPGLTAAKP